MTKLTLKFDSQEVIHDLDNNEIYLIIQEPFRSAHHQYDWNKLGLSKCVGLGINRKLLKYAIEKKANFLIKIRRVYKHSNLSQTYLLTFNDYITFLKEVEKLKLPYPEWKQHNKISIIVFPTAIMVFKSSTN